MGAFAAGCTGSIGVTGSGDSSNDRDDFNDGDRSGGSRNENGGGGGNTELPIEDGPGDKAYAPLFPAAARMMRLTTAQYHNSIRDIFGSSITVDKPLEADEATELFKSVGASKVGTSQRGVEQYQDAALDIAEQVFAAGSRYPDINNCNPARSSDACVDTFLRNFGRRLFRRSLDQDEIDRYRGVVEADGQTQDRLKMGMMFALAGMLMSPNFLYVPIVGEQDPDMDARRYTGIEMASRLSYFLWDSTPDVELLDAAEDGRLTHVDDIAGQVQRMFDNQRAKGVAGRFLGESWLVTNLDVQDKNTDVFSRWNEELVSAYHQEFQRTVEDVAINRPRDLRELFVTKDTFANDVLAALYGLNGNSKAFAPAQLDEHRFGLLTSGAVVSANSPSDRSSPTHRGVFVVERLLCQEIPPPPANVDNVLETPEPGSGQTVRERLEQHRTDPVCAGCHDVFDPAGLTFDNFDGIGAYRSQENGQPIDSSGQFEGRSFSGIGDLAQFLRDDERTGHCVAEKLYQYAAGHVATEGEEGLLEQLGDRAMHDGNLFTELALSVVTSNGFRYMNPDLDATH